MDTNETIKDTGMTPQAQPETTQDGELSEAELETVDGGLLPTVRSKAGPNIQTKPESVGIIAVLIG